MGVCTVGTVVSGMYTCLCLRVCIARARARVFLFAYSFVCVCTSVCVFNFFLLPCKETTRVDLQNHGMVSFAECAGVRGQDE